MEGPLEKTTSPRGPPDFKTSLEERKNQNLSSLRFPLPSSSLLFRGSYKNNNNLLNEKPIILLSSSSFFSSKSPFVQHSDKGAFFFVVVVVVTERTFGVSLVYIFLFLFRLELLFVSTFVYCPTALDGVTRHRFGREGIQKKNLARARAVSHDWTRATSVDETETRRKRGGGGRRKATPTPTTSPTGF